MKIREINHRNTDWLLSLTKCLGSMDGILDLAKYLDEKIEKSKS